MAEKIRNFIGGKWVDSVRGKTFESRNPADTCELLGLIPDSDAVDVDKAVAAARAAFPAWRDMPAPKRGEILYRAAELLVKRKNALGELVCREMGKILSESMGDVQEAIDMTYYMAGEGRRLSGETVPSELRYKDAKSVRLSIGVFALITPWNFPTAIPSWKITPALIAGNTVVFKPAEETPIAATRLVEIFDEAGLPPGVLNLVHGFGETAGEPLVRHPEVDGVSFTGSNEVGERLAGICGNAHKDFMMETGGKNPIIVMDDANLDLAIEGALWGGFGTTGQRCTASSRLIIQEGIFDQFLKTFTVRASQLRIGNGLDPDIEIGPVISEIQYQKILKYIEVGKDEGATLILGGHAYEKGDCARGLFIEPTMFIDVSPKMRIAQEEIFGPVVSLIRVSDLTEAIEVANDVSFGLSAAIYSQDINTTAIAERDLDTGLVYINASTIGAEIQLPFGGTKRTGLGPREAGGRGGALDLYTKWKVIYRDFSGTLQKAQMDE
ncbi:MAG: aldehyde dehydrogenase family protein [Nitrospira sp.]|nr:aldehyde dehydrogenase family protein [Candidatus Manganitrophaceae bacterium]HIL35820.1 aldehyde dehydrogenase family protein [Candidatus Manganitrophaceae bacterium]